MKKIRSIFFVFALTFMSLLLVTFTLIYGFVRDDGNVTEIQDVLLTVDGETREAELPLSLKDIEHGTEVLLSFSLKAEEGDTLFFGSVYAPLTIRVNGEEMYHYGDKGTFPSFFRDPPTQYDSLTLPAADSYDIQMRYLSPNERDSLSIHEPYVGSAPAILHHLLTMYGITMALAMFFLFLGMTLIGLSIFWFCLDDFRTSGLNFLQPGLLFLFSGAWQFGENPLSVFLFQCPSFLYVLDFLGMFLLMIPLYRMGILYLNLKSERILNVYLFLLEISAFTAMLLQLTGIVSFHRILYLFHILLPVALLLLTGLALYEYLHYKNRTAGMFFLPFLILAFSSLLELANYYVHFLPQFSVLFQGGLFLFVIAMAVFVGFYFRNMYVANIEALTLQNEVKIQENTIMGQKVRNEMLLNHFEEIRRQRHDIRHHLRTISNLLHSGETEQAEQYIQSVADSVPAYMPETFCDNNTINATLGFYAQEIRQEDISLETRVQVPESNPDISDANLCVIFGNLLENALEACKRMKTGSRFIRLNTKVCGEVLFITMDNSCDGTVRRDGDDFYSAKRSGLGTGLSSIRAIAESHNGGASFECLENEFRSKVYVRL